MNILVAPPAVARDFGHDCTTLDRITREVADWMAAKARARGFARDWRDIRKAIRTDGAWLACQRDAGTFGDRYSGLDLFDARDLAKACWAEARQEMRGE